MFLVAQDPKDSNLIRPPLFFKERPYQNDLALKKAASISHTSVPIAEGFRLISRQQDENSPKVHVESSQLSAAGRTKGVSNICAAAAAKMQ